MNNHILIQNDGEIEINSFELIGASTKRGDSTKIGFFGSGLKYSIAYMMRNNISFRIFSGLQEVLFTTVTEIFRGQEFEKICINGKPTSFTTTMGATWNRDWFVLREIYCNAVDEKGCMMVKDCAAVNAFEGKTRIYIEATPGLQTVIDKWNSYFSDERDHAFLFHNVYTSYLASEHIPQSVKIYPKTEGVIYRKGIRVNENKRFLFDYEFENVSINEDRTATSAGAIEYAFAHLMLTFCSETYVKIVLQSSQDDITSKEYSSLYESNCNHTIPNEKWIQFSKDYMLVVKEISGRYSEEIAKYKGEVFLVPMSFARYMKVHQPDIKILGMGKVIAGCALTEIEKNPKQEYLISEVFKALLQMNYKIEYDVLIAKFEDEDVLGHADVENHKIYLSEEVFNLGRREIALTLIEENEHINSKFGDQTKAFQTHIFTKWLGYMEDSNALFL